MLQVYFMQYLNGIIINFKQRSDEYKAFGGFNYGHSCLCIQIDTPLQPTCSNDITALSKSSIPYKLSLTQVHQDDRLVY